MRILLSVRKTEEFFTQIEHLSDVRTWNLVTLEEQKTPFAACFRDVLSELSLGRS